MKFKVEIGLRRVTLSLILVITMLSALRAQDLSAVAHTDTNAILIGDQITLTLTVSNRTGKSLLWPEIGDTITSSVEVLERTPNDTLNRHSDGTFEIARAYQITSFDSGFFIIPPFRFIELDDSSNFAETEAILIEVHTIEVDTTAAIKDIKTPYDVPYTWDEFIPHAQIALALVLLSLLAYYIYKKLKNRPVKEIIEKVIIRDPSEIALESLQALEEKKLWQQDKVKLYYTELTDIVRTYIESRFDIIAMEMTTDEITTSLVYVPISPASKEKLTSLLLIADMVKFAKSAPLANEHELCMAHAYNFVTDTAQIAEVIEIQENAETNIEMV